jgi:D-arabinose 1-dehydrogenase-like Zn-dependent alcohol dehydrogenase
VVERAGGPLAEVTRTQSAPGPGQVRVEVVASGLCRADLGTVAARHSAYGFPVVPGHEVAGEITDVGAGVAVWQTGDRVAVGWFGGSCGHCERCSRGDVVHCPERQVPGVSYPGGWAESITVPADALARIPDALAYEQAAPFGCAGVTTYNAIRQAHLRPGSRVAVFGIGGLGHLAVQFAARMGHETVAIARGADRESLAHELGAHHYLDSTARPPGAALAELGGADLIVSTASSTEPVDELFEGLRPGGQLTVIGIDAGSVTVPAARLVMNGHRIAGHLTGSPRDVEDAMAFAVTTGVRVAVERFPLERAADALDHLRAGRARFRIVLCPQSDDQHRMDP